MLCFGKNARWWLIYTIIQLLFAYHLNICIDQEKRRFVVPTPLPHHRLWTNIQTHIHTYVKMHICTYSSQERGSVSLCFFTAHTNYTSRPNFLAGTNSIRAIAGTSNHKVINPESQELVPSLHVPCSMVHTHSMLHLQLQLHQYANMYNLFF